MKAFDNKLLYALVSILTVVVVLQGFVLYDLKDKYNGDEGATKSIVQKPFINSFSSKNTYNNTALDPFKEMLKMQEEMQKVFGHFNSQFMDDTFFKDAFKEFGVSPLSDIKETKNNYTIELAIPGADEKKIDIKTQQNILKIMALSQKSKDVNGTSYIHKERYTQRFERSFMLPKNANLDALQSEYKNGILRITIPKKDS